MKITSHFNMGEFKCKDGTEVPQRYRGNVVALTGVLEKVRAHFNAPVTIVSGYRTKEYNTRCGGSAKSKHLTASAADMRVSGHGAEEVARVLERMIDDGTIPQGGIGVYPSQNFVHYDIRLTRARWVG